MLNNASVMQEVLFVVHVAPVAAPNVAVPAVIHGKA